MKAFVMLGAFAFATVAVAQTTTFTPEQRADGERQVVEAGKMLADSLRNPSTARFRGVTLFKTTGKDGLEHVSFCGEVNSQNGYGGMSGFQKFTVAGKMLLVGSGGFISADVVCSDQTPRIHDSRDYSPELRRSFEANAGQ